MLEGFWRGLVLSVFFLTHSTIGYSTTLGPPEPEPLLNVEFCIDQSSLPKDVKLLKAMEEEKEEAFTFENKNVVPLVIYNQKYKFDFVWKDQIPKNFLPMFVIKMNEAILLEAGKNRIVKNELTIKNIFDPDYAPSMTFSSIPMLDFSTSKKSDDEDSLVRSIRFAQDKKIYVVKIKFIPERETQDTSGKIYSFGKKPILIEGKLPPGLNIDHSQLIGLTSLTLDDTLSSVKLNYKSKKPLIIGFELKKDIQNFEVLNSQFVPEKMVVNGKIKSFGTNFFQVEGEATDSFLDTITDRAVKALGKATCRGNNCPSNDELKIMLKKQLKESELQEISQRSYSKVNMGDIWEDEKGQNLNLESHIPISILKKIKEHITPIVPNILQLPKNEFFIINARYGKEDIKIKALLKYALNSKFIPLDKAPPSIASCASFMCADAINDREKSKEAAVSNTYFQNIVIVNNGDRNTPKVQCISLGRKLYDLYKYNQEINESKYVDSDRDPLIIKELVGGRIKNVKKMIANGNNILEVRDCGVFEDCVNHLRGISYFAIENDNFEIIDALVKRKIPLDLDGLFAVKTIKMLNKLEKLPVEWTSESQMFYFDKNLKFGRREKLDLITFHMLKGNDDILQHLLQSKYKKNTDKYYLEKAINLKNSKYIKLFAELSKQDIGKALMRHGLYSDILDPELLKYALDSTNEKGFYPVYIYQACKNKSIKLLKYFKQKIKDQTLSLKSEQLGNCLFLEKPFDEIKRSLISELKTLNVFPLSSHLLGDINDKSTIDYLTANNFVDIKDGKSLAQALSLAILRRNQVMIDYLSSLKIPASKSSSDLISNALQGGDFDRAKLILKVIDHMNFNEKVHNNPFGNSFNSNYKEKRNFLIQNGYRNYNSECNSLISDFIIGKNLEGIEDAIKYKVDFTTKSGQSCYGNSDLLFEVVRNFQKTDKLIYILELLLKAGIDPNPPAEAQIEYSALGNLLKNEAPPYTAIKTFLKFGADPHYKSKYGNISFYDLAKRQNKLDIVKLFDERRIEEKK